MIYIYRSKPSDSARSLAEALGGRRIRQRVNLDRMVRPGDLVVCWGEEWSKNGVVVLNGGTIRNKLTDADVLRAAGIPTVEVARTIPVTEPVVDPALNLHQIALVHAEEFLNAALTRSDVYRNGVIELVRQLNTLHNALGQAVPTSAPLGEWLGRLLNHTGGMDLLNPPGRADYFVKKETLLREFRVHSFDGESIRGGIKRVRDGFGPEVGPAGQTVRFHPWVRSWEGGWRISYDGEAVKQRHRDLAHRAVQALGLTFGAVDIGENADGSLIVLEVNRAPGLEGGTITAYVNAIKKWMEAD